VTDIDVTDRVSFGDNDADMLPLTECVCGQRFGLLEFNLHSDRDEPITCLSCGRMLYFTISIRVFERKS
jgi:hypothetical protein